MALPSTACRPIPSIQKTKPPKEAFKSSMSFAIQTMNQRLMPPRAPTRKRSQRFIPRDIDEFLSSDLDVSFASTVSLNSPPKEHTPLTPDRDYAEPMDISPAPPPKHLFANAESRKPTFRPRAHTTSARLFGSDLSNDNLLPSPQVAPLTIVKQAASNNPTQSSTKGTQRSGLPTAWLLSAPASETEPEPILAPSSPMDDAMDVDTSFSMAQEVVAPLSFSKVPHSAHPETGTFGALFYHTVSPRRSFESPSHLPKKRRSVSPDSTRRLEQDASSSPGFPVSPSETKVDRMSNGKPTLQGLGVPPLFGRRARRSAASAMVQPSEAPQITVTAASGAGEHTEVDPRLAPPVRRAFSALLPPSFNTEPFPDESSVDLSADMSSPAQAYSKRQQVRTLRRCDGSESLRSVSNASVMVARESPGRLLGSPLSKYTAPGLGGFGDNEAHGKVLPCHKVTEDGLMRIRPETLTALIDGKFDSQLHDFHIIDCRFDYEYNGGHIPGAVNINNNTAIEELLLGPSLTKPKPSISGDSIRKTVLVFHCEFSAKRAPTFAKHLRAKDRAMNNMVYPKIHYPEIYILEGGYCAYFKVFGQRCEPPAYVRMDDPIHAVARREDLDQFRKVKFGRHKSYAYGEGASKNSTNSTLNTHSSQPQQTQTHNKRNTAPITSAPVQMFAAANAARNRRGGALTTLPEDAGNTTTEADDTDTDVGDSPCPPPTKTALLKGKRVSRPLVRAETYGPSRLTLGC